MNAGAQAMENEKAVMKKEAPMDPEDCLREIKLLWDGKKTRHPELDYTEWVEFLVSKLREIPSGSRSHGTIQNVLRVYQAGPMPESVRQVTMAG